MNTDILRIFSLSMYFVSFFAFRVVIWPSIEILTMPFCSSWKALSTEQCLKNSACGTWINITPLFFSHIWVFRTYHSLDYFIIFMWPDQNVTFHSHIFPSSKKNAFSNIYKLFYQLTVRFGTKLCMRTKFLIAPARSSR